MRKLAEFVQLNCTSSISIANFRLQARVINSVYKGFDAVNNDDLFIWNPSGGEVVTVVEQNPGTIS
jgi:hypothetical protein